MKKLRMTKPEEGPELAIVREFEDEEADLILKEYESPRAIRAWEVAPDDAQTTTGYALTDRPAKSLPTTAEQVPTDDQVPPTDTAPKSKAQKDKAQ